MRILIALTIFLASCRVNVKTDSELTSQSHPMFMNVNDDLKWGVTCTDTNKNTSIQVTVSRKEELKLESKTVDPFFHVYDYKKNIHDAKSCEQALNECNSHIKNYSREKLKDEYLKNMPNDIHSVSIYCRVSLNNYVIKYDPETKVVNDNNDRKTVEQCISLYRSRFTSISAEDSIDNEVKCSTLTCTSGRFLRHLPTGNQRWFPSLKLNNDFKYGKNAIDCLKLRSSKGIYIEIKNAKINNHY